MAILLTQYAAADLSVTRLNPESPADLNLPNISYTPLFNTNLTTYSFEDKSLNTGKYIYRLKQTDNNGNYTYFNLNNIVEIGIPAKYEISQNYPNPFNPVSKIDYSLPVDSRVSIKIYGISGREVRTLVNEQKSAGYYTIQIDAGNLSSGIYFYRIIAQSNGQKFVMTKKAMLIK